MASKADCCKPNRRKQRVMRRMINMSTEVKMTWDKEEYLTCHGYKLGTPEAEQAWTAKCIHMIKCWPDHSDIEYYRSFVSVLVDAKKDLAPMVMGDIKPYRSMIDGSMIESRSQHRSHLKQHGCIEVGNETKHLKPQAPKPPPGLKEEIIRQTYARKQ